MDGFYGKKGCVVKLEGNMTVESAMRQLKRIMNQEGVTKIMKERRYYETGAEKKQRVKREQRRREMRRRSLDQFAN